MLPFAPSCFPDAFVAAWSQKSSTNDLGFDALFEQNSSQCYTEQIEVILGLGGIGWFKGVSMFSTVILVILMILKLARLLMVFLIT